MGKQKRPKKKPEGRCRLCGTHGPLSAEHIPPQSAGNTGPKQTMQIADVLLGRPFSEYQNGLRVASLCRECNTSTADLYNVPFRRWSDQIEVSGRNAMDGYLVDVSVRIQPLPVLKQIIAGVIAVSYEESLTVALYDRLRRFVQNRDQRRLPLGMRVLLFSFRRVRTLSSLRPSACKHPQGPPGPRIHGGGRPSHGLRRRSKRVWL